jgi:hypothetical protein
MKLTENHNVDSILEAVVANQDSLSAALVRAAGGRRGGWRC